MASQLTTEPETRRFLAEFVRYAKPKVVVETGCHLGHTAQEISAALWSNEAGRLHTCDIEPEFREITKELCGNLPVTIYPATGVEMIQSLDAQVDMAFLDSGANGERVKEALALAPKLSPFAFVFLHDTLQTDDPCYDEILKQTGWSSVLLPYGRGLGMFWK